MGLSNGEEKRRDTAPILAWLLPATLVVLAGLLLIAGESGAQWLRFERSAIASGEVWRLLTGHLVHLGVSHYVLNAAGLVLVWFLVGREFSRSHWLWIMAGSVMAIDLGLWVFSPGLQWYVGLSGLLHGMLAAGIVASWPERRAEALILSVVVAGKLAFEQLVGPLPGSESTSGGAVIVDAHLYGVIGGVLVAAMIIRVRRQAPI